MRIEAITVCVDYSDFLAETLPYVLDHVDDMVVVTTPEDGRTQGLCHRLGVRCVKTHCFYRGGDVFNKANGINYGLMHLKQDGWVIHLDADIALPRRTRWLLENSKLDKTEDRLKSIYGVDRFNVVGRQAWEDYKINPPLQYESSCRIVPPNQFRLGSRLVHFAHEGYVPIGYFQMWNPRESGIDHYPDICSGDGTAERTDLMHALQWDREHRALIPELFALHLETRSKCGPSMGANWRGRTTPQFTLDEKPWRPSYQSSPLRVY